MGVTETNLGGLVHCPAKPICWPQVVVLLVMPRASVLAAHGFSSCGTWTWLLCRNLQGSESWTCVSSIGRQILNLWTSREGKHSVYLQGTLYWLDLNSLMLFREGFLKAMLRMRVAGGMSSFWLVSGEMIGCSFRNLYHQPSGSNCVLAFSL